LYKLANYFCGKATAAGVKAGIYVINPNRLRKNEPLLILAKDLKHVKKQKDFLQAVPPSKK
jgi:hypothetical protein